MAADAWIIHEAFPVRMANGTLDLDNDTFKCALFTSSSNASVEAINDFTDLTNEVSGNGYTAGGNTLGSVTYADGSPEGEPAFDSANTSFSASGGDIVFRWAVIYDDTDASKTVVAHSLIDNAPADTTITDGSTLNINMNASGIFKVYRNNV